MGLARRSEPAGRSPELGADPVRLPLRLRERRPRPRPSVARRRSERHVHERVRGDVGLYGAAGVVHDPELTRALLEAGASPDDGESVYHATEAAEPDCLRLLLDAGAAEARGTNALAHALDYDRVEPVRMLLEAGADPNEHAHVAHAVRRGRGPEFVRLLHEFGADLDRPAGETWRGDALLRTPYAHAVLRGRDDVARTLEVLGASTQLPPGDAAVAAISRGERPTQPLPDKLDYDAQEALILAALGGKV